MPEQPIENLVRYLEIYQIKEKDRKSDTTICIGGSSKSLTVYSDENILLNGTVYQCGGRLEGSLSGDMDSFAKKIEGLIPDFSNLLR
jgi:hypothetical protein